MSFSKGWHAVITVIGWALCLTIFSACTSNLHSLAKAPTPLPTDEAEGSRSAFAAVVARSVSTQPDATPVTSRPEPDDFTAQQSTTDRSQ